MKELRTIFMGTPDFAVPVLNFLIEETNVLLVVTQPDKEVGRDKKVSFSPIKKVAVDNNIDVFQPEKIKNEFEIISELNPDIIITCAYGQIIPKTILDIPKYGCLNVHASLLPKYRGSSPMQACLLNGDEKTGVTLMYMDEHMDTGDIISKMEIDIDSKDNLGTIHDKLSSLGPKILKQELPKIISGKSERLKQNDDEATYTKLIKREDELLDFNLDGLSIVNKVRAFNPYPLTYFIYKGNEIKLLECEFVEKSVKDINKIFFTKKDMFITCKNGLIRLIKIKPFGKKVMDINAYLNGIEKSDGEYVNEK